MLSANGSSVHVQSWYLHSLQGFILPATTKLRSAVFVLANENLAEVDGTDLPKPLLGCVIGDVQ